MTDQPDSNPVDKGEKGQLTEMIELQKLPKKKKRPKQQPISQNSEDVDFKMNLDSDEEDESDEFHFYPRLTNPTETPPEIGEYNEEAFPKFKRQHLNPQVKKYHQKILEKSKLSQLPKIESSSESSSGWEWKPPPEPTEVEKETRQLALKLLQPTHRTTQNRRLFKKQRKKKSKKVQDVFLEYGRHEHESLHWINSEGRKELYFNDTHIPFDVISYFLQFLDLTSLLALSSTSKTWRETVLFDENVWTRFFSKRGISIDPLLAKDYPKIAYIYDYFFLTRLLEAYVPEPKDKDDKEEEEEEEEDSKKKTDQIPDVPWYLEQYRPALTFSGFSIENPEGEISLRDPISGKQAKFNPSMQLYCLTLAGIQFLFVLSAFATPLVSVTATSGTGPSELEMCNNQITNNCFLMGVCHSVGSFSGAFDSSLHFTTIDTIFFVILTLLSSLALLLFVIPSTVLWLVGYCQFPNEFFLRSNGFLLAWASWGAFFLSTIFWFLSVNLGYVWAYLNQDTIQDFYENQICRAEDNFCPTCEAGPLSPSASFFFGNFAGICGTIFVVLFYCILKKYTDFMTLLQTQEEHLQRIRRLYSWKEEERDPFWLD